MNDYLIIALCGFAGGMARTIVGTLKALAREQLFSGRRFLLGTLGSGAVGAFATLVIFSDCRVALLAGYAGTDLLENAVRMLADSARQAPLQAKG